MTQIYNDKSEIVDEVINRILEYGSDYLESLKKLNQSYPVKKYKRVITPRNFTLPDGVKVSSTYCPKENGA